MDFQRLQKRVVGILASPVYEWRVIAGENDNIASVYTGYILWMAAIPAVCLFLGLAAIGAPFSGQLGLGIAVSSALYSYVGALVGPMLAALVIEKLAPKFKSSGSTVNALKLVAYASTPVWVAGVFYLFLYLAPLALVAVLYAAYLFYLGLPLMMKTHPENVVPYMVVCAIVLLVINIVLANLRSTLGMPSLGL
jgi:hypothetical protein